MVIKEQQSKIIYVFNFTANGSLSGIALAEFCCDCTNKSDIYTRQLRYGAYTHSQVLKLNTDTDDVETLSNFRICKRFSYVKLFKQLNLFDTCFTRGKGRIVNARNRTEKLINLYVRNPLHK